MMKAHRERMDKTVAPMNMINPALMNGLYRTCGSVANMLREMACKMIRAMYPMNVLMGKNIESMGFLKYDLKIVVKGRGIRRRLNPNNGNFISSPRDRKTILPPKVSQRRINQKPNMEAVRNLFDCANGSLILSRINCSIRFMD